MKKKLSWTPVRRGKTYCAPACGRGCLHTEYLAALKKATALAKELGRGWKAVVYENLGWHFRAVSGVIEVSQYLASYNAFFNGPTQFIGIARTPRQAVLNALQQAEESVRKQNRANAIARIAFNHSRGKRHGIV